MSQQTLEKNIAAEQVEETKETEQQRCVFVPRVSIERGNDKVTLQVELPGVDKNDVDVNLEKNLLTVSANSKSVESNLQDVVVREFKARNFKRVFELSDDVDSDAISAEHNNGVLKLVLPLRKPTSKKISLK